MNEEVFGYSELYRGNHDRGWIRNDGEWRKRYSATVNCIEETMIGGGLETMENGGRGIRLQ